MSGFLRWDLFAGYCSAEWCRVNKPAFGFDIKCFCVLSKLLIPIYKIYIYICARGKNIGRDKIITGVHIHKVNYLGISWKKWWWGKREGGVNAHF